MFQATPQRTPPARQPRPQTRSCARRSASAASDELRRPRRERRRAGSCPPAARRTAAAARCTAPRRRRRTGRRGSSPAARCRQPSSISSDSSTSAPPRPMPNCPPAARRTRRSRNSKDQPVRADAEAAGEQAGQAQRGAAQQQRGPARGPAGSRHADQRDAPGRRAPIHNQGLWCTAACTRPLAVSLPPKTPGSDFHSVRFCGKYQGSSTKAARPSSTQPSTMRCARSRPRCTGSAARAAASAMPRQRGSELTSFSHLEISRLRSALAPYLA